jgi:DNA-directed RNA polymerase beta' subunit
LEYSLYAMKLRLNESQEELRNDRKEEGLSEDTAPRENLYGIELPIATCSPFNGDFDGDTMAILSCGNTI